MKIGPKYKIARRLGAEVFDKTQTAKFKQKRANAASGGGKKHQRALTDYGKQMLEKQKVRFTYGVAERQFRRYIREVLAAKGVKQDQKLYEILETRLDNVVYRLGLAPTRQAARQLVSHGHVLVNGKRVTIPSFNLGKGDVVGIRAGSLASPLFANLDERIKDRPILPWLSFDLKTRTAKMLALPVADQRSFFLDLAAVLDFYKR